MPSTAGAFVRGKKTTTVMNLAEFPQGAIRAEPLPPLQMEPALGPSYPTVILQVRRNMQKFEKCVVVTRVGGFYEMYFEHAEECGPLLNLKVAQRKTAAGPVSMVRRPLPDHVLLITCCCCCFCALLLVVLVVPDHLL